MKILKELFLIKKNDKSNDGKNDNNENISGIIKGEKKTWW